MNNLALMTMMMTPREIAELTGKQYGHVLRDIDSMTKSTGSTLGTSAKPTTHIDTNKQSCRQYELDFRTTFSLIMRYSNELRLQVIDKWLESSINNPLQLLVDLDVKDLPPDRFVYVARESVSGRYKVGISKDPIERIKKLNVGNPEVLELVVVYKATEDGYLSETKAHLALADFHLRSEWFSSIDGLST